MIRIHTHTYILYDIQISKNTSECRIPCSPKKTQLQYYTHNDMLKYNNTYAYDYFILQFYNPLYLLYYRFLQNVMRNNQLVNCGLWHTGTLCNT